MRVVAFIGPSGSGKSYRALAVARAYKLDAVVDDGLLIRDGHIVAGVSAKRQATRVGAVKAALFQDPALAAQVKGHLAESPGGGVLLLATSTKMADRIAQALDLPAPEKYLSIEDIASPREIALAQSARRSSGQHVVPAPTLEVKPRFSGTMIAPLRVLLRHLGPERGQVAPALWVEQTVVRPTFTYLGRFYITDSALRDVCRLALRPLDGMRPAQIEVDSQPEGLTVNLGVACRWGVHLPTLARQAQEAVRSSLEEMTALNVRAVNLHITRLFFDHGVDHEPPTGAP